MRRSGPRLAAAALRRLRPQPARGRLLPAVTSSSPDAQLGGWLSRGELCEAGDVWWPRAAVCARSACRRRGARAAAVPPFSGPRSRATVAPCNPRLHQHRRALHPRGATANGACARGHHHRPATSGSACHAFAFHPGARAGGLGYGRRHHSRLPRPVHEQTVLMAQRLCTENGAPRAWAGARAPGHLPLLHACRRPAANVNNVPGAACRSRPLASRSAWQLAFRRRTFRSERRLAIP